MPPQASLSPPSSRTGSETSGVSWMVVAASPPRGRKRQACRGRCPAAASLGTAMPHQSGCTLPCGTVNLLGEKTSPANRCRQD